MSLTGNFLPCALLVLLVVILYDNGGESGTLPVSGADGSDKKASPSPLPANHVPQLRSRRSLAASDSDSIDNDGTRTMSCDHYHGNPCLCALASCDYIVTGNGYRCIADKKECDERDFFPGECNRAHAFYSVGGMVCENHFDGGDCERDVGAPSNFAVNLNGWNYTDANKVRYIGQNVSQSTTNHRVHYRNSSNYGISICKRKGRGDVVDIASHRRHDLSEDDISNLIFPYIEGQKSQNSVGLHQNNSCTTFRMRFSEDGLYEFNVKTAELEYLVPKTRLFDIRVNELTIFSKVNILQLAGVECSAIDLISNFIVRGNQTEAVFSGFPAMKLENNGLIHIRFCMAHCALHPNPSWDESYVVSAFSVTKLKGRKDPVCERDRKLD